MRSIEESESSRERDKVGVWRRWRQTENEEGAMGGGGGGRLGV